MRFGRGLSHPAQSWGRQVATEFSDGDVHWLQREECWAQVGSWAAGTAAWYWNKHKNKGLKHKMWSQTLCFCCWKCSPSAVIATLIGFLQKRHISNHWQGQFTYSSHAEFCLYYCMSRCLKTEPGASYMFVFGSDRVWREVLCMSVSRTWFPNGIQDCDLVYTLPLASLSVVLFKAVTDCDLTKMGQKI